MADKPAYEKFGEIVRALDPEIIKHKRTEAELHRYEHIVSSSTDMLALLDKRFNYLAVNKAYVEALKLTTEQLIGNTVANVFGENFFNTVIKPKADRCLAGEEVNYQEWFDFPAHGRLYMDINYYQYYDENNKIIGFVVNGRNITKRKQAEDELQKYRDELEIRVCERTVQLAKANDLLRVEIAERKRAEEALRESEEKYRLMMGAMKDAVYITSNEFRIEYMSPRMIKRIGRDATGEYCHKAVYDSNEKCSWCVFDQIQEGECIDYELENPRNNRIYTVTNTPVYHAGGDITKLTIFRDITDPKAI